MINKISSLLSHFFFFLLMNMRKSCFSEIKDVIICYTTGFGIKFYVGHNFPIKQLLMSRLNSSLLQFEINFFT